MRLRAHWGLSSGQTIGAARTAVRSACCLPELRVANRLRRLYPLDDGELFKFNLKSSVCQRQTGLPKGNPPCVFPTFPPAPLRIAIRSNRAPRRAASHLPRTGVGASCPCRGQKPAPPCATPLFHRPSLIRGPPNVPDAESLSFSSFLSYLPYLREYLQAGPPQQAALVEVEMREVDYY